MLRNENTAGAAAKQAAELAPASRFLRRERAVLERFLPGFDAKIGALTLEERERRGNLCIAMFKESKGPTLVIPKKYGGLGATALETVQVHRAVASRSPSLAIVMTMHNFSAATLVEYAVFGEEYGETLLETLAENSSYLASGFAEGRTGARPLDMRMQARRGPDGTWIISGRKKPCTLSQSMEFLTCGVAATDEQGKPRRAVALVPADLPGIERRPFWKSSVLGGAESDELILNDVSIPEDFLFLADSNAALDPVELAGFVWLQLTVTASYLGIGSALVERMLESRKGGPVERMEPVIEIETAMAALESVARDMMARESTPEDTERVLAQALCVRWGVQGALEKVAMRCAEILGGVAFISSPDVAYLLAASRGIAFHPPARLQGSPSLAEYFDGGGLSLA